jgi:hypothetical protein
MAPKRKAIRNDDVSRSVMEPRISKRIGGANKNGETTVDTTASLKKNKRRK